MLNSGKFSLNTGVGEIYFVRYRITNTPLGYPGQNSLTELSPYTGTLFSVPRSDISEKYVFYVC
jgi:hypothetical protein